MQAVLLLRPRDEVHVGVLEIGTEGTRRAVLRISGRCKTRLDAVEDLRCSVERDVGQLVAGDVSA